MKRLFTSIICLSLILIVKAACIASPETNFAAALPSPFFQLNFQRNCDTVILPSVEHPSPVGVDENIFRRRLDSIQKDIPLDYNDYVQSYIDIYSRYKDELAQVLGRSKYYFPIYEKAFKDEGLPDELKYLSIVESKLDPYAVSRVGATGPWQFMYTTAKLYGLNIDDYVDDRRDPIQATYAAAAYLKDAYEEFGDWLLAIASYNCGESNVEHAIEKAGASDFWSIRPYLPPETRNYVPAYIAVTYLMNYYSNYGIVPQSCSLALKTDTLVVSKYVSLDSIAQALNVDVKQLEMLNPAYKRMIVNGTPQAPRRLIIPQTDGSKYGAIYNALNNPLSRQQASAILHAYDDRRPRYHTVRRGETLRSIANRYGVDVQDLKVWNHLHSNRAKTGRRLLLHEEEVIAGSMPSRRHNRHYIIYKVRRGDTLSGIAEKFDGATVERIKELNGLSRNMLQPGMTLKINRS